MAEELNISYSTFYRNIQSGGSSFTIGEIHILISVLDLSMQEIVEIFLSDG